MKKLLMFLTAALLLAALSCQQDEFLDEFEPEKSLKNATVTFPYEGEYAGSLWSISLPENWNESPRYLIFYAHGMVDPDFPLALPNDFVGDKTIEQIVLDMNMGYATTSYRENGLVVLDAVEDIKLLVQLVNTFFDDHPQYLPPKFKFLGGPSEGGLVTALTIEKYPDLFDGALSICGPIGNFYNQLQYNGDFHVLFNYFFEDILQNKFHKYVGNPEDGVGDTTINDWNDLELQPLIVDVMKDHPSKMIQLLRCAKVKVDMNDQAAMRTAVLECLRFNVKLTNDVTSRLGGVPFNNTRKWYWGSTNDWKLNREVQRIKTADYEVAKSNVQKFETTANFIIPFVSMHTTGDHVTPYWHQTAYRLKVFLNGKSLLYTGIPVFNYGHCTIDESQLVAAVAIMIVKATLMDQFSISQSVFASNKSLEDFKQIMQDNSVDFEISN